MSDWDETTLGQVCSFKGGNAFPQDEQGSRVGAAPFIKVSDLSISGNSSTISRANNWVSEAQISALRLSLFPTGSSVFAKIGEGMKSERVRRLTIPTAIDNNLMAAVPASTTDPQFLYYLLQTVRLASHAVGSALPYLKQSTLQAVPVVVPKRPEQRAIAGVLGALDDKIAANTTLVDTLLEFVNTEFLNRFGTRDLDVPLGSLAEVVDCLHSKKPERLPEGPTLMQLNNIRDDGLVDRSSEYRVSADDYERWSKKFETRPWDLVITNVGRIGAVARIPERYTVAIGRNMTGIRPRDVAESGSFIAASLLSTAVRREIEQRTDAGSVMSALNVRSVPLLRLQHSTSVEREAFHDFAAAFFEKADVALVESAALAATRDALLPQLMSGNLRVREAEAAASEAGV